MVQSFHEDGTLTIGVPFLPQALLGVVTMEHLHTGVFGINPDDLEPWEK